MNIERFIAGPIDANNYVVWDENSKDAVLIDCSEYREDICQFIIDNGLNLKYILLTHGHFDHILGLNEMSNRLNVEVGVSRKDAPLLDSVGQMCIMFGIHKSEPQHYDFFVEDAADSLYLGSEQIKVINTPGHTEGGVTYLIGDCAFTGDTLFQGSYGRVDFPGGNFETIKNSLLNILFRLDENTNVYPGHGEFSTIKFEIKYNDINI